MNNEQYRAFLLYQNKSFYEDFLRNRISVLHPYNNVVFSSQYMILHSQAEWVENTRRAAQMHGNSFCNGQAAYGQAYMSPAMIMDVNASTETAYPVTNGNSMNKKLEAAKKWLKERKEARNG